MDIVNNLDRVYKFISDLKKYKRRLLTNCYFNEDSLKNLIENRELLYEYKEGRYLNLFCVNDDFFKLYFYIYDFDHYEVEKTGQPVVCDIIAQREDTEFMKKFEVMSKCDFIQYACYEKWMRESPDNCIGHDMSQIVFTNEKSPEIVDMLFCIFDKYTELLPRKNQIEAFLKEKEFINMYESSVNSMRMGGKYLGSLIYSVKGKVATEDFYFIIPEERGRGLSYLLYKWYYQINIKKGYRFEVWINEKNRSSIAVHKRLEYQQKKMKNHVLIRQ